MAAITVRNAYKIFGRRAAEALPKLRSGATAEDVKEYGTAAVIDASFDVEDGEIFVVMGLSGSGKSTLIRMLNGLWTPTAGAIEIGGKDLTKISGADLRETRQKNISMVFQHFALLPHRTVLDNAAYGLQIQGVSEEERFERARQALEMVDMKGWDDHFPSQLSGGMQQRVGLARALTADTKILLMDEAFSALDPLIRREMQSQLIDLQQKLGKTIVFITHDLNEAMRLGDRIAVMRSGRIVQIGTSEQILMEPANDYVARFISDVDHSRVLKASAIMEQPPSTLGAGQGPRSAHRLLRETQNSWLLVLNRDRTPHGIVWEDDIAQAVKTGSAELPWPEHHQMPVVSEDTPVSDLFTLASKHASPIVVVDEQDKFAGIIPRVTLLAAAGTQQPDMENVVIADVPHNGEEPLLPSNGNGSAGGEA